ncbi:MAG: dTDP-4-dehydrorhamnose 3,5-epimerase [Alphaproteobacteria bacterium]|nr:dTDP-4-dehydrorhamnose 3,5-epimerase [Alphaproteobacteria bacterium]
MAALEIIRTALNGVVIAKPRRFADARGYFRETYNRAVFQEAGVDRDFMQDNHAYSAAAGTVRGLHFQAPPFAQAKLVSVIRGAILDVAVDLRRDSATFLRHEAAQLSAESGTLIFIPEGFAHGYVTLEPDTEVVYKVNAPYAPTSERGIIWNDRDLAIKWPVAQASAILSDKDRALPALQVLIAAGDLF